MASTSGVGGPGCLLFDFQQSDRQSEASGFVPRPIAN